MKQTIIIAGVYTPGIGLSNVMNNLIHHLNKSFNIVCLGFDASKEDEEVIVKEVSGARIYLYPLEGTIGLFRIAAKDIVSYIDQYKPACFLTLGPIMSSRYLLALLQPFRSELKIISYLALEGKLVDMNYLKYARLADCCVFYTASVYKDFNTLLLEKPDGFTESQTARSMYIAHGVDKASFYPIPAENDQERRKNARKVIYKHDKVSDDTFIVLNMNRPSHRKNIEATIAGFKLFIGDKQDVLLHLHIGTTDPEIRQKYQGLIEAAGIEKHTMITPEPTADQIKPENWLNTLYNACDVGITTSKGEGWGLGLFEHAATRAAMIAPDHTSFSENWQDAAVMMPCSDKHFVFYSYCDMFIVSPPEVARALNTLYQDRELLARVTTDCYARAMEPKFDWQNVAGQFQQLIEEITRKTDELVQKSHY